MARFAVYSSRCIAAGRRHDSERGGRHGFCVVQINLQNPEIPMKCLIPAIAALMLIGTSYAQATLQGEKPQPVDSSRAQQDPEQRPEPVRKSVEPLAEEKRGETSTKSFEQLDQNKDGKLSKDELGADEAQGMDFSKIDRDGDGTISRDEWNAHWSGRHDKH